jgi:hypothetical protein
MLAGLEENLRITHSNIYAPRKEIEFTSQNNVSGNII